MRAAGRFQKAQDIEQNSGSRWCVVQQRIRIERGEIVFKYLKPPCSESRYFLIFTHCIL